MGTPTNPFVNIPTPALVLLRSTVVVYILAAIAMAAYSRTSSEATVIRLGALLIFLMCSCAPILLRFRGMGVFHPLFFLSTVSFLRETLRILRSTAYGMQGHIALPGINANDLSILQAEVLILGAASWLMIILGFSATKGSSWNSIRIREKPKLVQLGAIASFVVGCVAFWLLARLSGGFLAHIKNTTRGFSAKVYVLDPELASLYAVFVNLTLIAPVYLMLKHKAPVKSLLFWSTAIISTSALFLVNARRSDLLTPILVLCCCWILRRRQLAFGRLALIAVALFLSLGILGEFRKSNWDGGSGVNVSALQNTNAAAALAASLTEIETRAEGAAIYPIIAKVPQEEPYLYGVNYLAYFNRFIPRAIWKDKPRGIGVECGRTFYGVHYGIPPGTLGEAFWSGGIIGVVIVSFLWGVTLKFLATFFLKFGHSIVGSMLYLITIAILSPNEPAFRAWLFIIVPPIVLLIVFGVLRTAGGSEEQVRPA